MTETNTKAHELPLLPPNELGVMQPYVPYTNENHVPVMDGEATAYQFGFNGQVVAIADFGDPNRGRTQEDNERVYVIDLGENNDGFVDAARRMQVGPGERYVVATASFLSHRRWASDAYRPVEDRGKGWMAYAPGTDIIFAPDTIEGQLNTHMDQDRANQLLMRFSESGVGFADLDPSSSTRLQLGAERPESTVLSQPEREAYEDMVIHELGRASTAVLHGAAARELSRREGGVSPDEVYFEGLGDADYQEVMRDIGKGLTRKLGLDRVQSATQIPTSRLFEAVRDVVPGTPTWDAFNSAIRHMTGGREALNAFYKRYADHFAENAARGMEQVVEDHPGPASGRHIWDMQDEIRRALYAEDINWRLKSAYDKQYGEPGTMQEEKEIDKFMAKYLRRANSRGALNDALNAYGYFGNILAENFKGSVEEKAVNRILEDHPQLHDTIKPMLATIERRTYAPERHTRLPRLHRKIAKIGLKRLFAA